MSALPSYIPAAGEPILFDPFSPDFIADPVPILRRLREQDPVHCSRYGWILTRFDDAFAVLRNKQDFGNGDIADSLRTRHGNGAAFAYFSRRLNLLDAPDHTRLRALVMPAFAPKRIEALQGKIRELVDSLLDRLGDARSMDVIADLAHALPSLTMCEILGIPATDRAQLEAWSDDVQLMLGPACSAQRQAAGEQSIGEFMRYVEGLISDRRGIRSDGLLAVLIEANEGGVLSREELVALVLLLFSAGHVTTCDLVGNGLVALLGQAGLWQRVAADASLLPKVIDECLRYAPAITMIPRTALRDVGIGGKSIAAGEQIWVSAIAANRDPARFADPDRFDIDRPAVEHLAFGGGIHYCLGAWLGRAEAHIILAALCQRCPRLALAGNNIEWRTTFLFHGPASLRVTW